MLWQIEIIVAVATLSSILDIAMTAGAKKYLANHIRLISNKNRTVSYIATDGLNKIFGPGLLSRKSFRASVIISILSMLISYIFAYLTSDLDQVAIFPAKPINLSYIIFFVFLIFIIISDVLSYMQTRIFVKAIDYLKNDVATIGLVIADGFISISCFIFFFSVARTISYVLVAISAPGIGLQSSIKLNLDATHEVVSQLKIINKNPSKSLLLLYHIADIHNQADADHVSAEIIERYKYSDISAYYKIISVKIKYGCDDKQVAGKLDGEETKFVANFLNYEQNARAGAQYNFNEYYIGTLYDLHSMEKSACGTRFVTIDQRVPYGQILRNLGLQNALWAGFERTASDFELNIVNKFANYIAVDPTSDIGAFAKSDINESAVTPLGIHGNSKKTDILFDSFDKAESYGYAIVGIPFSALLASSLTMTFLIAIYVLVIFAVRLGIKSASLVSNVIKFIDIDKWPLTLILVTSTTFFIAFYGLLQIFDRILFLII